jgi:hypothetical protein
MDLTGIGYGTVTTVFKFSLHSDIATSTTATMNGNTKSRQTPPPHQVTTTAATRQRQQQMASPLDKLWKEFADAALNL